MQSNVSSIEHESIALDKIELNLRGKEKKEQANSFSIWKWEKVTETKCQCVSG